MISGAPASGKTTIVTELARRHADLLIVPEAATQHYSTIGRTWDKLDLDARREAQRAIYRLQVKQEADAERTAGDRTIVLDRGTVDGSAYWPDGPAAYWADLGTTHAAELARYGRVILLETAAAIGIYDGSASNNVRFEDPAAAVENGRLLATLWAGHPDLHVVPARPDWSEKLAAVEKLIFE